MRAALAAALGDPEEAASALERRGFPRPTEDALVIDAVAGFEALRRRLLVADEWAAWYGKARRTLGAMAAAVPTSEHLDLGWATTAAIVGADAAVLAEELDELDASFRRTTPSESTGGRPRRLVRNFVYTLDWLWSAVDRPRLTPGTLALVARAMDSLVDGAIWTETMKGISRQVPLTQPWKDILRAVRPIDIEHECLETFVVRRLVGAAGAKENAASLYGHGSGPMERGAGGKRGSREGAGA